MHLDGTCEPGTDVLFAAIATPRSWTLAAAKITSENIKEISQLLDAMLGGFQLLRCDLDRHTLADKCEPKVLAASGCPHAALLLVNHQLQTLREVTLYRRENSFGTADAFDENKEVIGVTHEPQSTAFQFLIQVVEQNV